MALGLIGKVWAILTVSEVSTIFVSCLLYLLVLHGGVAYGKVL